jgi:excisionase family DNA binding protein
VDWVVISCSGLIEHATIHVLNDHEAKQKIHAQSIGRSPATLQADKLQPLRQKPTLCDPNPCTRSAAVTAKPWVSVDQIAEHLGVTRDSICRWIDRKSLPAHRVGRLWKFQVSEVDDWVRAGGADETQNNSTGKQA